MIKKKYDLWSWLIIAFFAGFFIYGLLVYKDYGATPDDEHQRYHTMVAYNDVVLGDKEYVTQSIDTTKLPSLKQYGANYGVFLQLPLMLVEHLNEFQYSILEVYQMRHLYVFLWYFISLIFFYRLCLLLTEQNRGYSFLGVMMLILFPRTLAHAFYNIKDLMCMPLYTIAAYFGVSYLKRESWKSLLLFVLFAALCTTTRVVGGVLIVALMGVIIFKSIEEGTWKKYFLCVFGMGALFLGVYILMTPKSWGNIIQNLLATIKTFSNYTTWDSQVYYMGQWVRGNALPWHYLFVWIGITIPFVYLIYMMIGLLTDGTAVVVAFFKRKMDTGMWVKAFLLLATVAPFVYVLLFRPVLYNGWRHFYFTYPLLVVMGISGLQKTISIWQQTYWKKTCLGVLLFSMAMTVGWIIKNHPYEFVYFNPVFREYAYANFDVDYWCMTEIECLDYILSQDDGDSIKYYELSTACSASTLDMEEKCPLVSVYEWNMAEWVIDDGKGFEGSNEFECVKAIEVDGHWIRSVWRRKNQNVASYMVEYNDSGLQSHSINHIDWTVDEDDECMIFTGTLTEKMFVSAIDWKQSFAEETEVELYVSHNGMDWLFVESLDKDELSLDSIAAIRVSIPKDSMGAETESFTVTLQGDIASVRKLSKLGNRAMVRLETNSTSSSPVKNVKDDNRSTRWEVNNQTPGVYLDVHLDAMYSISKVQVDHGSSDEDYARELHIYTSVDGVNWEEQSYTATDHENYVFDQKISCQYVRLQLGDTGELIDQSWSVYELRLFTN